MKREQEKKAEKKKAKERQQPMTDFTLIRAEGFEPFVVHERHEPVPIAMVNRAPHGSECCDAYKKSIVLTSLQPLAMRTLTCLRMSLGSRVSVLRNRACSCTSTLLSPGVR